MKTDRVEGPTAISRDWRVRLAVYGAALFAYLAAGERDPLTPFQLVVFVAACSWSLIFEHFTPRLFFSTPLKILLILVGSFIFVGFIGGHLNRAPDSFANAIARFLFWNAIVFILSRGKTEYDVWTLAIIIISLFMISGAFVQPAAFLLYFAASVLALTYTFQRLALLRTGPAPSRGGWRLTVAQFIVILDIAVLVFVLFPRGLFWAKTGPEATPAPEEIAAPVEPKTDGARARSGLPRSPGRLNIGTIASVKADPTEVMRLRLSLTATGESIEHDRDLYLRQDVLVEYLGGGQWRTRHAMQDLSAGDDGVITPPRLPLTGWREVHQAIELTPAEGMAVPVLPDVAGITAPKLGYDSHGVFTFQAPLPRSYRVVSRIQPANAEELAAVIARSGAGDEYLGLPAGLANVRSLAQRLTAGKATIVEKVRVLRDHLLTYSYSLAPPPSPAGVDLYDHFVDRGRTGYCIHFAGALVLMCRAVGIPARIAAGLHLTKDSYDASDQRYVGRNSDAHAWTEVWLGNRHGWLVFDATPAESSRPLPAEGTPVATGDSKGKMPDAQAIGEPGRWDDAILNYDPKLQGRTLARVGAWLRTAGGSVVRTAHWIGMGVAGVALLAGLIYVFVLPRSQKMKLQQALGMRGAPSSVDFYAEFLWLCAKHGLRKPAGMTGVEFAALASTRIPEQAAEYVTKLFYRARYGGTPLTDDERLQVGTVLRQIEALQRAKA